VGPDMGVGGSQVGPTSARDDLAEMSLPSGREWTTQPLKYPDGGVFHISVVT